MDVKEAVNAAKTYVAELFANEGLSNLGLEEVEFDDSIAAWKVTVGFSRPWDRPASSFAVLTQAMSMPRSYKVVLIEDATGRVVSVKNRESKS